MNQENTQHSGALIGAMREAGWAMRGIASIVILTFGGLVTAPAVAAVKQEAQKIQWHKAEEGHGAKLSAHLHTIRDHLKIATASNLKTASFSAARKQFKDDATVLADLDKQSLADFASTRAMIKDKHLPDVIMQRETAAETHYKTEMAALRQGLDSVVNEKDDAKAQADSKYVLDRLSKFQMERAQQKFDPKNLPNRSLKPDLTRKPFTTKKQFAEAGFIGNPRLMVATTAPNFDYSQLPGANNPAYLAATTEVTLSPAIQAQAAALNYNPVQIYNWVRNNIQWQPTWGAVQDADLTLSAQRGNAFDISSLLIALLRASNIPARYVLGTINVPADKFRNWVGGFQDINAAVNYASAGGIPITSLYAGGQITTIQMQHIWVEAAIDYMPSHGVINKSADAWVPMDASYKQYAYQQGLNALVVAGINTQQLATSATATSAIDPNGNWVSGINTTTFAEAKTQGTQALQTYINQNLPNATVGQVLGGSTIVSATSSGLAVSLENQQVAIGARYGALPTQLEQSITFALGQDALGDPQNPVTFPSAQVNNHEVILSFMPATPADQQALQSLIPSGQVAGNSQFPTAIPAYLINVVPQLKIDGVVVSSGSEMTLGSELTFVFAPNFAGRQSILNTYNVIAGSYLDIAAIAGNVGPNALNDVATSLQQTNAILQTQDPSQLQALTQKQLFGDEFHAAMLGYYAQYTNLAYAMGLSQGGRQYLAAGIGSFGFEPQVDYTFGIPKDIHGGGAVMNVPIVNVFGYDGSNSVARMDYVLEVGLLSSALEATVPQRIFSTSTQPAQAVSAVTLLSLANQQGQKTYVITPQNQSQVLPNIAHDSGVMQDIENALASGKDVVTFANDITAAGWTGAGYVIFDPQTGDGAYKIGGGANGSVSYFLEGLFNGVAGGALFIALFANPLAPVSAAIFALLIALVLAYYVVVTTEYEIAQSKRQVKCFDAGVNVGATLVSAIGGIAKSIIEGTAEEAINALVMLVAGSVVYAIDDDTLTVSQQCLN